VSAKYGILKGRFPCRNQEYIEAKNIVLKAVTKIIEKKKKATKKAVVKKKRGENEQS
jgi:hypothetical protein